jgi:hypothetical protein
MRGLQQDRTASVVIRGHAFVQNLRRGNYELGTSARRDRLRVAAAFDELARAIRPAEKRTMAKTRPPSLTQRSPADSSLRAASSCDGC